ncbi:hypothetical protein NPIL_101501 [Nephila pilipes]|uniref:Uncharacterized protein n=1 Tax=Nephila pilipes TaxID=299642 RepID=A0A8X6NS33_NEPPI|nr:hypothetical protein NPIL_101501 [Nephila pilipes]
MKYPSACFELLVLGVNRVNRRGMTCSCHDTIRHLTQFLQLVIRDGQYLLYGRKIRGIFILLKSWVINIQKYSVKTPVQNEYSSEQLICI